MELWKDIKGFEGLYQISSYGRVWNSNTLKYLGLSRPEGIHITVLLRKNNASYYQQIHRLVAEAFLPNPDNLAVVMHMDDNPLNNNVNNLRWGTYSDNLIHAIVTGKRPKTPNLKVPLPDFLK